MGSNIGVSMHDLIWTLPPLKLSLRNENDAYGNMHQDYLKILLRCEPILATPFRKGREGNDTVNIYSRYGPISIIVWGRSLIDGTCSLFI